MKLGVFTTIKVKQGIPFFFEHHQKRLLTHAKALRLGKFSLTYEEVNEYLKKNNLTDCALKISIKKQSNKTVAKMEHRPFPDATKELKIITVIDTRNKNKIYKTTDRVINEKAKQFAEHNHADDAIFINKGNLLESTIANIFSLDNMGNIITPPLKNKGLEGIVRKIIIKNLSVIEKNILQNENTPLVLTNSLRIQKVSHLNGKKLPNAEKLLQKIKTTIEETEKEYLFKRGVAQLEDLSTAGSTRSKQTPIGRKVVTRPPAHQKIFYKTLQNWVNPEIIFTKLFGKSKNAFWLDSSLTNSDNRFSYMGNSPTEIYSYFLKSSKIVIQSNNQTKVISQDIFSFLKEKLSEQNYENTKLPFPFAGGFVGYFGYELKSLLRSKNKYTSKYPDSLWFKINNFIAFDHKEKKVYLVSIHSDESKVNNWFTQIQKIPLIRQSEFISESHEMLEWFRQAHHPEFIEGQVQDKNKNISFKLDKQQYIKAIETCKTYLEKGKSYQICLTNKIRGKIEIDPLTIYLTLRKNNPAPYSAYIKFHDLTILCSSPEEFLKIDKKGIVETKPIKGTIKRDQSKREDKKIIKILTSSKKDWSENAMIVDLLRNDLGKVCEFGSIKVTKPMAIESYQTVHQLVSTIRGKLRKDVSSLDCIKACFPGGSMTGAPKIKTMEILDSLEKDARGIYSGALGFLSFNQTALLNIVIRTIVMQKKQFEIGAGGAILAESDPEKEYQEMLLKASALMQTLSSLYNPPMYTTYLALGANIGNKKANIHKAIKMLSEKINNISIAKFYKTKPMYFELQNDFLNTALRGETDLSPKELLKFIKNIEEKIGRKKTFRNGPREIDIDILFYDNVIFKSEELQIPHPRIQERPFVLQPLMDIAPDFVHPVVHKTIREVFNNNTSGWQK